MDALSAGLWHGYFRLRNLPPYWRELDRYRDLAPDAARRDLARRLLSRIQYFGKRADALPEWREAASIRDPETLWKIWHDLPVVNRQDLRTRFAAAEMQKRFGIDGQAGSTGGSTGEPTRYLHDRAMLAFTNAARAWCRLRLGWKPGMPTVCVWGSERDIGHAGSLRNRLSARLRNDWLVDGYSLDSSTVDRVLDLLRRRSPVAMYGFTSMLEFVARETLRRGAAVPGAVACAWNGGEMLFDRQTALFREAFGVPILNLYGCRELSSMAVQPAEQQPLIPLRPFLFLEILDDRGRPASPGQSGRLVWTSTVCGGTPFLRYECGDLGTYCPDDFDESGIRRLRELHGRSAGLINLNGKTINNLFWNHLFKEFPGVEQFQIAVKADNRLEIRLKGSPFRPEQDLHLRNVLGQFLGETPVRVSWVERIAPGPQGKLEQVVREP